MIGQLLLGEIFQHRCLVMMGLVPSRKVEKAGWFLLGGENVAFTTRSQKFSRLDLFTFFSALAQELQPRQLQCERRNMNAFKSSLYRI